MSTYRSEQQAYSRSCQFPPLIRIPAAQYGSATSGQTVAGRPTHHFRGSQPPNCSSCVSQTVELLKFKSQPWRSHAPIRGFAFVTRLDCSGAAASHPDRPTGRNPKTYGLIKYRLPPPEHLRLHRSVVIAQSVARANKHGKSEILTPTGNWSRPTANSRVSCVRQLSSAVFTKTVAEFDGGS